MNVTTVRSNVTPPALTPPSESNTCYCRTEHIALAILASLAAFVFLPVGIAIILTAVVTLGTVCSALGNMQTASEILKQKLAVLPDSDEALRPDAIRIWGRLGILVSFHTPEALEIFRERHAQKFADCVLDAVKDGDLPISVLIRVLHGLDVETGKFIISQLEQIYGKN